MAPACWALSLCHAKNARKSTHELAQKQRQKLSIKVTSSRD